MRILLLVLSSLHLLLWGSSCEEGKNEIFHAIEKVINGVDPQAFIGVKVISLDDEEVLYEKNSQKRFVPASSLKLFTAAAALVRLGE